MALRPNSCRRSVAGNNFCFVGEYEEAVVDGGEELPGVATGQVGAAYGSGEESVPGQEEVLRREGGGRPSLRCGRGCGGCCR